MKTQRQKKIQKAKNIKNNNFPKKYRGFQVGTANADDVIRAHYKEVNRRTVIVVDKK